MYRELLLGCGAKRTKDARLPTAVEINAPGSGVPDPSTGQWKRRGLEFQNLTTLDNNTDHYPNMIFDLLDIGPPRNWPLAAADTFDEIHAYEVLEHIGAQGDYKTFFAQFTEFHRILKPGGLFFASCPAWFSSWAWGDPSHTRVITAGTLSFLSQRQYREQVGKTPMSDFRHIYHADFECLFVQEAGESLLFVLQAVK